MDKSNAILALNALGQTTRLDVFRLLVKVGPEGLPAGEIASRLGVRQNTLSTHLAILTRGGVVRSERQGRVIRYAADFDGMRELTTYLLEDCCRGAPQVCKPVAAAIQC